MLISKEVEIKVNNRYLKKYEKLGYGKLKRGDYITLPVEHLPKSSSVLVLYKCEYCNKAHETMYRIYTTTKGKDCCKKCAPKKYKETCQEKYGVDNTSKLPEIHDKIKETCLTKYGDKNFRNPEKTKETISLKDDNYYSNIHEKYKKTCLERFGVENSSQSPEIFKKQQKARLKIKKYKNTNLYYQGSYELDFLDNFHNQIEIENGHYIKYDYNGKNKTYFPDFYLPKLNAIVEVKSSYIYNRWLNKNLAKEKSCIEQGYSFIFIINKDYTDLIKFIQDHDK